MVEVKRPVGTEHEFTGADNSQGRFDCGYAKLAAGHIEIQLIKILSPWLLNEFFPLVKAGTAGTDIAEISIEPFHDTGNPATEMVDDKDQVREVLKDATEAKAHGFDHDIELTGNHIMQGVGGVGSIITVRIKRNMDIDRHTEFRYLLIKGPHLRGIEMAALVAGDCAGGDHRGRLAAGIRVAKRGVDGYWLELYTDQSKDAVVDLLRKYAELKHEAKGDWRGGQLPFQHPCPDRPAPQAPNDEAGHR